MGKIFDFIGNSVDKLVYKFLYFMDNYFWSIFIICVFALGVGTVIIS